VRAGGPDGKIDEVDESERLGRRVIDGDIRRADEKLEDQRVDIGQHQEEAVDKEQRQCRFEPGERLVAARAGRDIGLQPTIQQRRLSENRNPQSHAGGREHGDRRDRKARGMERAHHRKNRERVGDEAGKQRKVDPVQGAARQILHRAGREDRQRQARDQERDDVVGGNAVTERKSSARQSHAGRGAEAEAHEPAAGKEAAQAIEIAAGAIFGNEALRGRGNAERARHAEKADPGPDIDIDAEFEAPHPAREQHLAQIDDAGACDSDDEGGAGRALGGRAIARVGAPRRDAGNDGERARAGRARCPCFTQRHPEPPVPSPDNRLSALIFGWPCNAQCEKHARG